MRRRAVLAGALLLTLTGFCQLAAAQADSDRQRAAKVLFFDGQYAEARLAWQTLLNQARGAEADAAAYWIARCSEKLKQDERALQEYADYLARGPADKALVEEARTSRVGLAARLWKAGKKQYLPLLGEALADSSKTVRYFAALQLGGLGPEVGRAAVPVLKLIVASEKDPDLVDRAKLTLLKIDPRLLAEVEPLVGTPASRQGSAGREVNWVKIRVFKTGAAEPEVSINLPVGLAELIFKSLPDDVQRELKRKGYADAEGFWQKLKKLGPSQIIDIRGDDGERIQIWLE